MKKYTVKEFANEIRTKHPSSYDDLSDEKLVELWLKKFPEDRDKIKNEIKLIYENQEKINAIDFCLNKYVVNRFVDIWVGIVFTGGLAVLFFPILIWFIYRYFKAKKEILNLRSQLKRNPDKYRKIKPNVGYSYSRFGQKVENSVELIIDEKTYSVPNYLIWLSKYKNKETLIQILNSK